MTQCFGLVHIDRETSLEKRYTGIIIIISIISITIRNDHRIYHRMIGTIIEFTVEL